MHRVKSLTDIDLDRTASSAFCCICTRSCSPRFKFKESSSPKLGDFNNSFGNSLPISLQPTMPSLSKLIAWSTVAVAACASAMPEPEAGDCTKKFLSTITIAFPRQLTLRFLALDARDINIIINTHDKAPSDPSTSSCDPKNCFIQCEDGGAIGGVCDDSGCHCQYGSAGLTLQDGLTRGNRLALMEENCDLDTCNQVCYQKGGFAGGVCDRYDWQTQP